MKKFRRILTLFFYGFVIFIALATIIPFLIPVSKAQPQKQIKHFDNSEYITINNILLHYRIWKNQDPINAHKWILLLHGMGGSSFSWENNASVFCDSGYNVVALDIPPFGYSDKNPNFNHSVDNRASLIWNFANKINSSDKWILIGHSMGGGIVQCMAILKPQKVNKAVLVAPALFSELKPGREFSQYLTAYGPVERIMCLLGEYIFLKPQKIKRMLESSYAQEVSDEVVSRYFEALNNDGFTRAFIRSFSKANTKIPMNGLDFKSEAIAFVGTNDTWVPYESIKPITDKLTTLQIVQVENAGHCIMETHAEYFNKVVLNFIK